MANKQSAWWCKGWVINASGRQQELILGPFNNELECQDVAYNAFIGDADIRLLPTVNETRASHFFRYAKFAEGATPTESMERFRHRGADIGIE